MSNTLFNNLNNNYIALYPEMFLTVIISGLIGFLVILDYVYKYKMFLSKITANILIWNLFLVILLLQNTSSNFLAFNGLFYIDSFTTLIKEIIVFTVIICIIISLNYITKEEFHKYEYYLLLGLATLGMLTIVSANDLISMYIGIEIQSLCFYIIGTLKIYNNFSTEAGLKYFILGAFSSGVLLFGCSLIYGSIGTTNFSDMKLMFNAFPEFTETPISLTLGLIFIIIAILFKIGAAPFHMWLPDVYEGVPTIVTAVYSIVPKIGLFALFIKLNISVMYENNFFVEQLLLCCAFLSIAIGTFGALFQTKIKRLLAYSAISHVGFLLIGFVVFDSWSIFALIFYLIVYIVISINLFTVMISLRKVDNNLKVKDISELAILFKTNPFLALNLCVMLFSIAGIPPLAGFYSKLYIFMAALRAEYYLIVIIAAIFSVIAAMYYIRLIKIMYFKNVDDWAFFHEIPAFEAFIITITFFFNLLFFCYPELIIVWLYNIVLSWFF